MSDATPVVGERPGDGAHVIGWKAIGLALGVSVRTVQRWERTAGLPVRRIPNGNAHETVYAERAALEAWLKQTRPGTLDAIESVAATEATRVAVATPPEAALAPRRFVTWPVFVASLCAAACVFATIGWLAARTMAPAAPTVQPVKGVGSPPSLLVGDTQGFLVGRIVIDTNGNGQWDAGESFIAEPGRVCPHSQAVSGFVVQWSGPSQGTSAPLNCNPEPFYHGRLKPGRHHASLLVPQGWETTSPREADIDVETARDTHLWFAVRPVTTRVAR